MLTSLHHGKITQGNESNSLSSFDISGNDGKNVSVLLRHQASVVPNLVTIGLHARFHVDFPNIVVDIGISSFTMAMRNWTCDSVLFLFDSGSFHPLGNRLLSPKRSRIRRKGKRIFPQIFGHGMVKMPMI